MTTQFRRTAILVGAVGVLLSACSSGAPDSSTTPPARTVELTMTEQMTFEPARIEVRGGESIRFVVRNMSNQAHEVYIGNERQQQMHATEHSALAPAEQTTSDHIGFGVHVAPFGNGALAVKFDGPYELLIGCHYPGHYQAGMRAVIEVTE